MILAALGGLCLGRVRLPRSRRVAPIGRGNGAYDYFETARYGLGRVMST